MYIRNLGVEINSRNTALGAIGTMMIMKLGEQMWPSIKHMTLEKREIVPNTESEKKYWNIRE